MKKVRKIGILTGGGDVPGLNSVIKSVVYRGWEHGAETIGIRRGFEGLTHVNLDDAESTAKYILPLTRESTRTIDRHGGTMLHSTRVGPSKVRHLPVHLQNKPFPAPRIPLAAQFTPERPLEARTRARVARSPDGLATEEQLRAIG